MTKALLELAKQLRDAAHYCTQLEKLEDHCREVAGKLEGLAEAAPSEPPTAQRPCENCEFFEMLWKWFQDEQRCGAEYMRAERRYGLSAYDFKNMLDEHEAALSVPPGERGTIESAAKYLDDLESGMLPGDADTPSQIAEKLRAVPPGDQAREDGLIARIETAIIANDVSYKDMILQQVLVALALGKKP